MKFNIIIFFTQLSATIRFQVEAQFASLVTPVRKAASVKEVVASTQGLSTYAFSQNPIVPNRWQGECNCLVGPFSSETVADYFANSVVDFGHYETMSRRVFAKGDSWYVEVHKEKAPSVMIVSKS